MHAVVIGLILLAGGQLLQLAGEYARRSNAEAEARRAQH